MEIEIRPADTQSESEVEALMALDKRIFLAADCFDEPSYWQDYQVFWIFLDGRPEPIGSIALGHDTEIGVDWKTDKPSPGCLYIASTGLLPEFQSQGIGSVVKQWEIDYAKAHRFERVFTHCRASNAKSLGLNQKFGFAITRTVPDYYEDPKEDTVVLELKLKVETEIGAAL